MICKPAWFMNRVWDGWTYWIDSVKSHSYGRRVQIDQPNFRVTLTGSTTASVSDDPENWDMYQDSLWAENLRRLILLAPATCS